MALVSPVMSTVSARSGLASPCRPVGGRHQPRSGRSAQDRMPDRRAPTWIFRVYRKFCLISPFNVAFAAFCCGFVSFVAAIQVSSVGDASQVLDQCRVLGRQARTSTALAPNTAVRKRCSVELFQTTADRGARDPVTPATASLPPRPAARASPAANVRQSLACRSCRPA